MPKGGNSKAEEARQRDKAKKVEAAEKKKKDEEDARWQDDDKGALRAQERKEQRDRKLAAAQIKKTENKCVEYCRYRLCC